VPGVSERGSVAVAVGFLELTFEGARASQAVGTKFMDERFVNRGSIPLACINKGRR